MTGKDTVSVIIPTWNRSATLKRAVLSALTQTLPPLEVLVCDDGSTDDTEQIVRSIDDNRVKWVTGERAGRPAIPRNRGIRMSRGEWIAFLDDDDVWMPEKLATQLELVKNINYLACCTSALRIYCTNEPVEYSLGWSGECLTFRDLLRGNRVICSSAMVHRSLFNKVVEFPESPDLVVGEDYALWLRVSTITNFAFVNKPLVLYMDSPQTSIRAASSDPWRQKRMVIGNFIFWGCRKKIASDYLKCGLHDYYEALLLTVKYRLVSLKSRVLGCIGE